MKGLVLLALVFLAAPVGVSAQEKKDDVGTTCGLQAFVEGGDAGRLALYDGLRKGLELAQLPRVCRAAPEAKTGGVAGFLERLAAQASVDRAAGRRVGPVFAIGDGACEALRKAGTHLPRVLAVERYTIARGPLRALPQGDGAALVYADRDVESLGRLLRALTGAERPAVAWAFDARAFPVSGHEALFRVAKAAHLHFKAATKEAHVAALLHLRMGVGETLLPFDVALRQARKLGVPLITDDRGRFGQGAVFTLVARHDLVGRRMADIARRLRAHPQATFPPLAVRGVEVWIDLKSADAAGLSVPMGLLVRADRLKAGRKR